MPHCEHTLTISQVKTPVQPYSGYEALEIHSISITPVFDFVVGFAGMVVPEMLAAITVHDSVVVQLDILR
jgi:hypothetical protein